MSFVGALRIPQSHHTLAAIAAITPFGSPARPGFHMPQPRENGFRSIHGLPPPRTGIALASGDHTTAERSLRAAIHSIEGRADSHLELSAALIKLGTLKLEMSALGEAEEFFRRALEIGEKALGRDNLGLVPALKGLGTTRLLQAKAEAAAPLLA